MTVVAVSARPVMSSGVPSNAGTLPEFNLTPVTPVPVSVNGAVRVSIDDFRIGSAVPPVVAGRLV